MPFRTKHIYYEHGECSGGVGFELEDTFLAELAENKSPKVRWQLAYPLVSKSHGAGPFELTTKNFEEIVANYRNQSTGRIAVCFEHHASLSSDQIDPRIGSPAQGWVTDLEVGSDGCLYGMVELYEPARSYVKEGRYKYMSPAIRFGTRDRTTGKPIGASIEEVSLTNLPHLEKQKGVYTNSDKTYNQGTQVMDEKEKLELETLKLKMQAEQANHVTALSDKDKVIAELSEKVAKFELADKERKEAEAKREEEEAIRDVEVAFTSYQKLHNLKDSQKKVMLSLRKVNKEGFAEMYPAVEAQKPAEQAQLSSKVVTPFAAYLQAPVTLNDDNASAPRSVASQKLTPFQLSEKQQKLTKQYQEKIDPVTNEKYTISDAIKLAVAELMAEVSNLWQLHAVTAKSLT